MPKVLTFFLLTVVALFAVGSTSADRLREIDARTGRMRERLFVCGSEMRNRISETDFSKLWLKYNREYPEPLWQPEGKTSAVFGGPSPHFGYHGAFFWQMRLVGAFEEYRFEPQIQTIIISNYVKLLSTDRPYDAQNYSSGVLGLGKFGASVTTADCPDWVFNPDIKRTRSEGEL
jgi:hypothetical protein